MESAVRFLKDLREEIIAAFEKMDGGAFERKAWSYEKGHGGGEMAVLRGKVFEKAAVNWSGVEGDSLPGEGGSFFATGISLITHMANPHAPTVHMNLRFIRTEKRAWFGGGYDLTPMGFFYLEDRDHFHSVAREAAGEKYAEFSKKAADYFYIPHWKKERGVGGLFFDHHNVDDFALIQSVGKTFLGAILPIYERRIHMPFTEAERQKQLQMRAHYVEFNLLYDRGTRFGFESGGNPEAILCSMPPLVKW